MVQIKDTNIAVRLEWETWKTLDNIRATRTVETRTRHTISDIVREAINHYLGDTCQNNRHN